MDTEKIVFYVLIALGLLFTVFIFYYLIRRWLEEDKDDSKKEWPPSAIMEMSEAQCPDYWINSTGLNQSKHKCMNKFNLPMHHSKSSRCGNVKCTDPDGNSKTFSTLKVWGNESRDKIKERCLWRDCCGPQENIPASWVGISNACGY